MYRPPHPTRRSAPSCRTTACSWSMWQTALMLKSQCIAGLKPSRRGLRRSHGRELNLAQATRVQPDPAAGRRARHAPRQPATGDHPVKGFVSTLATIWRLAMPYFCSEDRWPAASCCRRGRDRAVAGRASRAAQPMERPLLQRAAGPQLGRFVSELMFFCVLAGSLHRARRLSALSQSVAADPLAALDDRAAISTTGSTAPTTTACSCSATPPTTPTSASPRTSSCSSSGRCIIGLGLLERGRDAVLVRGHPVDAVGGGAADAVRRAAGIIPGYLVWAALIYAVARHRCSPI